jgi:hypothetical protein
MAARSQERRIEMGDDKTKEPAAQEAAAQEDVELADDEAEDVKGGGGGNWAGKPQKQGGGNWSG